MIITRTGVPASDRAGAPVRLCVLPFAYGGCTGWGDSANFSAVLSSCVILKVSYKFRRISEL